MARLAACLSTTAGGTVVAKKSNAKGESARIENSRNGNPISNDCSCFCDSWMERA
jgi:hypothetical protein